MKRRNFLQMSALGGAALGITPFSAACQQPAAEQAGDQPPSIPQFELDEMSVADLQQAMEEGRYSARKIAELYLGRIEEIDRSGPAINSVIELNPDALSIADQLDQERKAAKLRGPLHGIPVLIKDNIDTADKMMTTAGSLALLGSTPKQDSWVAQKLREAGALILGKTNLSEWANFRSNRSSSGWSGRGGQTRNPYVISRNPCGSSSGSGAAVSANLCAVAIGTETNGSVVCPSTANGIVGIKPTVGLWGRSGIIPISHSQDTAGPMCRSLRDAATLLGAITGVDPRDPLTRQSQGKAHTDYTQFLDPNGLQGARIGVGRSFMGFHERVDALMEDAMQLMKDAGATLIELESVSPSVGRAGFEVLLYEFKHDLNQYLASLGPEAPVKSLEEVIAFNEAHKEEELKFFGQEILIMAQEKGGLEDKAYLEALEKVQRSRRQEGIDKVMNEHQLDAIIGPTGGPAWPIDLVNGDHFGGGSSSPAAQAGYPNITIPAGFVFGLPVGISFFGRAYSEPTLLKIAYAYEQASGHRRPPRFLADIDPNG
ncbi:MAG: amidase [Bacteroidetes bacterium]|nr:MAG: amidase [Bacteroidota bacterium]